jgi:hypothetical protein
LKEKLIKIGAKVVSHGRYVAFQMAEVPGCANLITLSWVTAYHSFGREVEAFEHPHDTPPYPFIPSPTFAHSSSLDARLTGELVWCEFEWVEYLLRE